MFLGSIGSIVAGWFGANLAAASAAAFIVGGAVVGAAAGALISAVSGGDIFEGLLYGAVGGAALGYGGYAMGFGSIGGGPAALAGGSAGGDIASLAAAEATVNAAPAVQLGISGGTESVGLMGNAIASTAPQQAVMGGGTDWATMGAASYVGGSFLTGKYNYKAAEKASETNLTISREGNASRERMHDKDLEFARYKFDTEFEDIQNQREVMQEGIRDAADYMGDNMPTVAGASYNTERKAFIKPPWKLAKNTGPQADQNAQVESGFLGGNMKPQVKV